MQITGQQISSHALPESARHLGEGVRLLQSIAEIEAMLERARAGGGSIKLTIPMSSWRPLRPRKHSRWRRVGAFVVGIATVVAAVVAVAQWQGWF